MKVLISPPMRFGKEFLGGMRRTLEVYSRINEEVYLCVDEKTFNEIDPEISPLLSKFHVVKSSSTDKKAYLKGFINCLKEARKVDVIISYSEYSLSVYYTWLLSIFSRKPFIVVVHHVTEQIRESKFLRFAINRSKGIICLDNPEVFDELKKLFPKKIILTSTNGVNVDDYYTEDDKVCDGIFIGNYGERKGVKYLFQIWDKVNEKVNAKLCILGKGWKETPKNSVYYGFVSEKEKRELLAKSKVFVFPSLYEGFSLAVAEALSSYLPVVTWDLPWSKRYPVAIKVKFDDVNSFAEEIIKLLRDDSLRKEVGKRSREFAKTLTWDKAAIMEREAIYKIIDYELIN
ncbi:glycosyltransferase family 4 protein [Sulfurisphaera ohwakuensis]|uniref:Glycosyltransferase n=1 Tax=Sulfurisphaera ohwakuensis TaxID=69656 RepID=A0A650CJD4_SULOH|nr:glycosyltransferase family 4 protein [Sulfurisphaera ohwakuensis]MBB5254993.1 glycosyltransferase involved in cell wall biosynthesis [Sulfurisphaera ohwakuensis]QGR17637.1 glycosyltransferase [Sulfurisphaera ohwakuensis]